MLYLQRFNKFIVGLLGAEKQTIEQKSNLKKYRWLVSRK